MTPFEQATYDRWFDGFLTEPEAVNLLVRTGLSAESARVLLHGEKPKDEHPLVSGARKRLDSLNARTPPGYPLHYVMQRHIFQCQGCGARSEGTQMLTCRRARGDGAAYSPTALGETIYDLPVRETRAEFVTPRCNACFDALLREAVPALPPPGARLKPMAKAVEIDLAELGL